METPRRRELDNVAMNIELTLISIIQGVAIYFLVEYSRNALIEGQYAYWPYIAAAFTFVCLLWSRVIIHALTIVRWPLEFVHNFLYIAATLLECVTFTQVTHPLAWFLCSSVFAVLMWGLFVWDLRLFPEAERSGPRQRELCALLLREQKDGIRFFLPGVFFFNAAAAWAIHTWPEIFLERGYHVCLAAAQLVSSAAFLAHSLRYYRKIMPTLTAAKEEN